MKTTLEFPDDLFLQIKIEAARRRMKLKELVPELLRLGLAARAGASSDAAPELVSGAQWLEAWLALGTEWSAEADVDAPAGDQLRAGRDRLERT